MDGVKKQLIRCQFNQLFPQKVKNILKEIKLYNLTLIQANSINLTDLTSNHVFHTNIIAYCQQNQYVWFAIYTDLFRLNRAIVLCVSCCTSVNISTYIALFLFVNRTFSYNILMFSWSWDSVQCTNVNLTGFDLNVSPKAIAVNYLWSKNLCLCWSEERDHAANYHIQGTTNPNCAQCNSVVWQIV